MGIYRTSRKQILARTHVTKALRNGIIKRGSCGVEFCKDEKTAAHHYISYEEENWLDIQWLCRSHHHQEHWIKNRDMRNDVIKELHNERNLIPETLGYMFKLDVKHINKILGIK